jgi:arylsulfatase A-like enzyme
MSLRARLRGHGFAAQLAAACIAVAGLGCGEGPSEQPPGEAGREAVTSSQALRNVVLVCIDTVRYDVFHALDDVGGDPFAAWSKRAVRFDRAQSTAPWTVPAVASALTGLHPQRHGAGRFDGPVANLGTTVPSALSEQVPSLPTLLFENGLQTRAFVAHSWLRLKFGLAQGLEALDYHKSDGEILRRALEWLQGLDAEAEPFLLYLHFMRPHRHMDWDEEQVRTRRSHLTDAQRAAVESIESMPFCRDPDSDPCARFLAYAQSIAELRRKLTWLLATLEKQGQLDSTLVVLFADHGEEFMDHARTQREWAVDPRGVYGHGHGQSMYQELLHVPLMVWHPSLEGGHSDLPVSLADITPSVLDWLDLEAPGVEFDGEPLGPLLEAQAQGRPLFSTGVAYGPEQLAVVRGDWKRVLFQLSADPDERSPADEERIAAELDALLDGYAEPAGSAGPGHAPQLSDEAIRALQELGYLEEAGSP